uniref:Uncharacterized protein n=1 Tax=Chromera velia CCMP2878 TaxID=1169474 RepID=A0A0G4IF42_9ALVE|mmetsp:Transcript_39980/g.78789  ORF Transcript_39980/g.78789 Transcript_39980/m.78789 type:complete len:338 (-) Transcript_39980:2006-3019(-)|eukprot:Cvel_2459.t1-p1 / transcript=Cvel_2459.t1 / gene=Cvel_2459 / organism=Chromera_velia_CCMP2878 / gene_product=Inorganic pyrophosphatase 1, putative / transcript_product=Inorganic pyrophosphatase 1, putative / location=Cvel_scaffold96:115400-117959(+) / protein_length=337 / sequence_SO=supercontig / SO=protein_coding / is_pseudo=false
MVRGESTQQGSSESAVSSSSSAPSAGNSAAGIRVAFLDFDWTLVECDSVTALLKAFAPSIYDEFIRCISEEPFTDLTDRLLRKLLSAGVTLEDMRKVLCSLPVAESLEEFLSLLKAHGFRVHVVSHSNRFLIDTILNRHGLEPFFSSIESDPAVWEDEKNALRLFRFSGETSGSVCSPHSCRLCPENMCKGDVVEGVLREATSARHSEGHQNENGASSSAVSVCPSEVECVILAGAGRNDACAVGRLSQALGDKFVCCPRTDFGLDRFLRGEGSSLLRQLLEERRSSLVMWRYLGDLSDTLQPLCQKGKRAVGQMRNLIKRQPATISEEEAEDLALL